MVKKKKPLTDEEHFKNVEMEFKIYEELSKLREGKQVRDYIKAHKEDIKKCGVDIPFHCRYPDLPIIILAIACAISVVVILFK